MHFRAWGYGGTDVKSMMQICCIQKAQSFSMIFWYLFRYKDDFEAVLGEQGLGQRHIKFRGAVFQNATVFAEVTRLASEYERAMVVLDSMHTHEHVLNELRLYSQLVCRGSYLVVFATIVQFMPHGFFGDRPWGKGNNPWTAVQEFLRNTDRFVVDSDIPDKRTVPDRCRGHWGKF